MRAWEIEKLSSQCQIPVQLEDNNEEIWLEQGTAQEESLHAAAKIYWGSRVPGSLFRDTMAVAAIQATENRGRIVERSDELLLAGFRAITENDIVELHRATHQLFEGCRNAVIDESVDYWQYRLYDTFDQYVAAVRLPERQAVDMGAALEDRLHAGWLGQIIGGAYGACMEGYTTDNILKAYSDLRRYIRKPNTYNDDITYELALLAAYEQHGAGTTSRDIAFEWLSRIGFGWSAEDMALRNLRWRHHAAGERPLQQSLGRVDRRPDARHYSGPALSRRRRRSRPGRMAGRGDLPLPQRHSGRGIQCHSVRHGLL